jgi:hypothetical protein
VWILLPFISSSEKKKPGIDDAREIRKKRRLTITEVFAWRCRSPAK